MNHRFSVLGVPHAVVEEIPVEGVGPRFGVATRAALPCLEAEKGVVPCKLAASNRVHFRLGTELDEFDRLRTARAKIDAHDIVREVHTRVDFVADDRERARRATVELAAVELHARLEADEERQELRNLIRGRRIRLTELFRFFRVLREPRELFVRLHRVDDRQFMRARETDANLRIVGSHDDRPRIRRAGVHVVEKNRVHEFALLRVDDAKPVRVHPAALDLSRRELITREDRRRVDVFSVRRKGDVVHTRTAVGETNLLRFTRRCVEARDLRRDVRPVGRIEREEVRRVVALVVEGQNRVARLVKRGVERFDFEVGKADLREFPVVTQARVDRRTVRRDAKTARGVPDDAFRRHRSRREIDRANLTLIVPVADVHRLFIFRQTHVVRNAR